LKIFAPNPKRDERSPLVLVVVEDIRMLWQNKENTGQFFPQGPVTHVPPFGKVKISPMKGWGAAKEFINFFISGQSKNQGKINELIFALSS